MRLKSRLIFTGLLLTVILLTGCMGGADGKSQTWAIKVNSYHFADKAGSGYSTYVPDEGYTYLVVNVSLTNLTQEPQDFSMIFVGNTLNYVSPNGNRYDMSNFLSRPSGHLPESYKAQQTRSGDVYIQVPVGTNPREGDVVFKAIDNPKDIVLSLKDTPENVD